MDPWLTGAELRPKDFNPQPVGLGVAALCHCFATADTAPKSKMK